MTRAQIIGVVRAKMDEIHNIPSGVTIADPQIEQQLDSAAVDLIESLPSVLAMPVSANPLPTTENYIDGFSVDVKCPADFVRIHRLRLQEWKRSVNELFPDSGKLFYMQDYKHIKSTIHRPTAALYFKDGFDYITCYPTPAQTVPPSQMIVEFVYVKRPPTAESLDEGLIDLLAWNCASIVYAISGQSEFANQSRGRLNEMVQTKLKYRGL